jgi:hypothetical protein
MTVDWKAFLRRLRAYPTGIHKIRPPATQERIRAVEEKVGKLPSELADMLGLFNGAELFKKNGFMLSLFGLTEEPPLPPFEWGEEWYIDRFTPMWRHEGKNRQNDWAIAMMNYGELILLDGQGKIKKWDTSERTWAPGNVSFDQWLEEVLREGDEFLNED